MALYIYMYIFRITNLFVKHTTLSGNINVVTLCMYFSNNSVQHNTYSEDNLFIYC